MNLLRALTGADTQARSDPSLSVDAWLEQLMGSFGGPTLNQTMGGGAGEKIDSTFAGYVQAAYKTNGVVFACMLARLLLFSEARFQFRQLIKGRPGALFATPALSLLEAPWTNGTTGDLLTRMIQDVDLAGNFYATRRAGKLYRLKPDWVSILVGSQSDPDAAADALDAEVVGYLYHPGGPALQRTPTALDVRDVVHYAPIPDPAFRFTGISWLNPVITEIQGDNAATQHKLKFFQQGATPNMVVSLQNELTPEKFKQWVDLMDERTKGLANAYRTLYLAGGADAKVVGADMKQIDFKTTQGAGETRIAAAAGVPPVIVGLSEGLEAATYSNYSQARRRFADGTIRPMWRNAAGSLAKFVAVPEGAQLWYDDRDIPFLQEDRKDAAEIQGAEAVTIKTLIEAGYTPESAIAAVTNDGNWQLLEHTGMTSIQLHPPGTAGTAPAGA